MISRVRQWLAAIRSVSKTAQEAGRAVAAVPQLDEKIAQIREESNRLSTLYEAVTGRTAIATDDILKLNAQILQLTDTIVQMREESNRLSALHEEEAKRLSTLHEEKFNRLSALHDEESNRLSALHEESDRLSALHEEESGRLSALHEEESGRLSALQEESNRLSALHEEESNRLSTLQEAAAARTAMLEQNTQALRQDSDNFFKLWAHMSSRVGELASRVGEVANRVGEVANRERGLADRVGEVDGRLEDVADRVGEVDRRAADTVKQVEDRLAEMADRLKEVEDRLQLEQRSGIMAEQNSAMRSRWDELQIELLSTKKQMIPPILGKVTAMLDHLIEQQRVVVAERDVLKNRKNELLARIRQTGHQKGTIRSELLLPFPKLTEPPSYLPIHVIDVGAQPLVSEDHVYAALKKMGPCIIIGFEALADKAIPSDENVHILNNVIGAGGPAAFHVAYFDPTSSLLEANLPFLRQFMTLAEMCKTVSEHAVETTRLDDIPEIADCDFLKLDVQGGELEVLRGAGRLLGRTIVVHTEVEFSHVYKDQPLFTDIDTYLRAQGFELIDLVKFGHNTYAALPSARSASRLLWSDAIYFRSTDSLAALGPQKLLRAAYIAHVNYGMWDLAAHILARYDSEVGASLLPEYLVAVDRI